MRTSLAPPATPRSTLVGVRAWVHRHRIVSYVVLAYALSWSWWIPLALHGSRTAPGQGWPTHLPGLLGPALAAVIVTALADGRAGLRELTARALRWRIRWRWYVLLIATVAMLGLAPLIATLRGDPLPTAPEYLTYSGLAVLPALPTLLIVLLVNGFGEELGWRGFLADDLLRRHGMLSSALMVTPIWVLWHVPTFWVVETYRSVNQTLLLAFDGTEYFSSHTIHCPNCSTRHHANGSVTYCHTALTPVLVKPGLDKVIPLAPEFVRPQDGAEKQDCELNAAQRWLADCGGDYSPLGVTLLGDDLYCHEPFCRDALNRGFNFILVCKPASHPIVSEWVEFLDRGGAVHTVVRRRWTGQRREIDTYRYAQAIPLRDGDDALLVNWCELTTTDERGNVLYHNTFVTNLALDDRKVLEIVAAGRC